MTKPRTVSGNARRKTQRPTGVTEKRVRGADGHMKTMRIIDLSSPTLSDDLTYLFEKNVEKARRENKRVTGSADGVSAKK